MSRRRMPPVAVVGAGRLASALAPLIAEAGYPVVAIAARRSASARKLARRIPGARATVRLARAIEDARIVLLAVRDDVISDVASELAGLEEIPWSSYVVLHHAGSLGPGPLKALARSGAEVGVLHPLQCLAGPATGAQIPDGTRARIEGTPRACRVATALARAIGLVPLAPGRSWSDRERVRYHAAASLASNDLLALLSHSVEALRASGVAERDILPALLPLVHGTLRQAAKHGIAGSLTGPAVRGDLGTLRRQLEELERLSPQTAEVHRLLSLRLIDLAQRAGIGPDDRLRTALASNRGGSTLPRQKKRRISGRARKTKV